MAELTSTDGVAAAEAVLKDLGGDGDAPVVLQVPPSSMGINNSTVEGPDDDHDWEDDEKESSDAAATLDPVTQEAPDQTALENRIEAENQVVAEGSGKMKLDGDEILSPEVILSSCKTKITELRNLSPRLSNIPQSQRVVPVQSGIEYLLASTFTTKVLQVADYFPSTMPQEDRDSIVEILKESNTHYETCKTIIDQAHDANEWTTTLSRELDKGWKNFSLQILAIPDLLHLPPLNLSQLIGNTIIEQVRDSDQLYRPIINNSRAPNRPHQSRIMALTVLLAHT